MVSSAKDGGISWSVAFSDLGKPELHESPSSLLMDAGAAPLLQRVVAESQTQSLLPEACASRCGR